MATRSATHKWAAVAPLSAPPPGAGRELAPRASLRWAAWVFGIALSVSALALSGRGARAVPGKLARLGPVRTALDFIRDADRGLARNPRLLLAACAFHLTIIFCDATSVWVLIRSLGTQGSPSGVFAGFMISSLLRTVGFVPGGLGTFEAASVVTLRMVGVPLAVALAATLLFRGLSFWLPMLPGLWLSGREMARGPTRGAAR